MTTEEIRTLYEYLYWAHERLMASLEPIKTEEFTRDLGSGHPSLRHTLVHMMGAEWLYLSRWHGVFPNSILDPAGFPDLASVEERWSGIRRELRSYLSLVRDHHLNELLIYRNIRGDEVKLPLFVTLSHLVQHNTYHRGQVATLLRQLGYEPAPTDLNRFYMEERVVEDQARLEDLDDFGSVVSHHYPKEDKS